MTRLEIDKVRGLLLAEGWTVANISNRLTVTTSAVYQTISGDCVSERIQKFIADTIGYWPWDRKPGEPKHA